MISRLKNFITALGGLAKDIKNYNENLERGYTFERMIKQFQSYSDNSIIDMKKPNSYWLRSPKAKRSKKGSTYIVIPIRHKTREMPGPIYKEMRAMNMGDRLTKESEAGKRLIAKYGNDIFEKLKKHHQTGKYEGLTKVARVENMINRGHSYLTFRTLSTNSPRGSWLIKRGDFNRIMAQKMKGSQTPLRNLL